MNFSPKRRFLDQKPLADQHRNYVGSEACMRACEAALAQAVITLPGNVTPEAAAANYNRMLGAQNFMTAFLGIAEEAKPVEERPTQNLKQV